MEFKEFLLTEQNDYFNQKIADILTAVQELIKGGKQIGARLLVKHADDIVARIRKILHTSWPKKQMKNLRKLQRCGVALAKCIDEKGDLREILNGARAELEDIVKGKIVNNLGTKEK